MIKAKIPIVGNGRYMGVNPDVDPDVANLKKAAIQTIVDKAKKIAYDQDQLFQPTTKHLAYAMLDEVTEIVMLFRAFMGHMQAMQDQVHNLKADLEALRIAVRNDDVKI